MALTASATPAVQVDIINSLQMSTTSYASSLGPRQLVAVKHGFNRPNLFYEVRYTGAPSPNARMKDVWEFIASLHERRGRPSSGIVYCLAKRTCDELAGYLRGKGLNARPYHKGLPCVLSHLVSMMAVG